MLVQPVVAVLGLGVVAPDTPILRANDLGALRGDGIFETIHIRHQQAWLIDEHLDRLTRSAARMDLALPADHELRALVNQALAAWSPEVEGALRLVCTRGPEDSPGAVTVFVTVSAVSPSIRQVRQDGIAVVTASLGVTADARQHTPWLLGGAKTLSYAVNMASQRWAQSVGADDVLWVSADGYALEAPTSTLVWLDGTTLCTVPVADTGILAGTTARWLLNHADALGWGTDERMVTPAGLGRHDGAWLTSSVRGLAAIRSLDGSPLPGSADVTRQIRELLGYSSPSATPASAPAIPPASG